MGERGPRTPRWGLRLLRRGLRGGEEWASECGYEDSDFEYSDNDSDFDYLFGDNDDGIAPTMADA